MDSTQKDIFFREVAKTTFVFGECAFIGVAIGSIFADNPAISRWTLMCIGVVISCFFFFLNLYLSVKHKIK
jgi:NADH:ubiquinone oxidoreductase subunit 6 (subunit J)